jgi:hypothetical protein
VIYAIGFQPSAGTTISLDGSPIMTGYDGKTGALTNVPRAWGFGIAYPSQAPDGVHWDVGISSFLDHMAAQVSSIVIH